MSLRVTRGKRPARRNNKPGMPIPSPKRRNLDDGKDTPEVIVGCGDNGGYWLLPDFGHQSGDIPDMMRGIVVFSALRWQVRRVGLEEEAICGQSPQSQLLALGEEGHESRKAGINVRELDRLLSTQTRPDHFQGSVIRPVLMPPSPSQVKDGRLLQYLLLPRDILRGIVQPDFSQCSHAKGSLLGIYNGLSSS